MFSLIYLTFYSLRENRLAIHFCQTRWLALDECHEKFVSGATSKGNDEENDGSKAEAPEKNTLLRRVLVRYAPRFFNVDEVPREQSLLREALSANLSRVRLFWLLLLLLLLLFPSYYYITVMSTLPHLHFLLLHLQLRCTAPRREKAILLTSAVGVP